MQSKRTKGYYQNDAGRQEMQYTSPGYQRAKYEGWLNTSFGFSKQFWQMEVVRSGYDKKDHTED